MKKILSLLLAAALLLLLSPAALAAELGENSVSIATAAQFITFAANCARESYSINRRFVLQNDIDLSELDYVPAGYFAGSFDGRGHTIRGLVIDGEGSRMGLFREIGEGAAVENLHVEGRVEPGGSRCYVGGIAGVNNGTIANCRFTGDVRGVTDVGGITGLNGASGIVRGSVFSGFLIGEHQVGGVAGQNLGLLERCEADGEVNTVPITPTQERSFDLATLSQDDFVSLTDIAGIVGDNSGVVSACTNRAAVGYPYTGYNVGGVAGKSSGFLHACVNEGAVEGRRDVGGVAGQLIPKAVWELSNGKLEELSQAISYMHYLLDRINQGTQDFSYLLRQQFDSMNTVTTQAIYAVTDVFRQVGDGARSIFDGIGIDPSTGWITVPNAGGLNVDLSALNNALYNMYAQTGALVDTAKTTLGNVGDDIQDISHQMGYIMNLLFSVMSEDGSGMIEVQDMSLSEAYEHSEGAIADCVNRGAVHGETNAGGVAGSVAFEISFDMEDTLNSSSLLPTHAEQYLFAAIRACESNGSVRTRADNAGGVVGRLDIGAVVDCVSTGQIVSQSGSYVGGVAGTAKGTVARCWARSSLEGKSYLGGIAGLGADIQGCRSWVHIERGTEYLGAVAGWSEGEVSANLYVDGRPDGVDGVSRIGQAEPLGMAAFLALEGAPEHFDTVTLRFVAEGETVQTLELPFGGAVERLPEVPNRGTAYWVWEDFDPGAVYCDREISGNYYRPDTTLSSGEELPRFLVEGEFYEDQSLRVVSYAPDWEGEDCLGGYTLAVNGWEGTLTVRMRSEESVRLYEPDGAGGWREIPTTRDGRYLVFPLPNGGSFAVVQAETVTGNPRLWIAAAAGLVVVLLAALRLKRRKKRRARPRGRHAAAK